MVPNKVRSDSATHSEAATAKKPTGRIMRAAGGSVAKANP